MQEKVLSISPAGAEITQPQLRGRVVRSRWVYNLLTFLVVFGPGLIALGVRATQPLSCTAENTESKAKNT